MQYDGEPRSDSCMMTNISEESVHRAASASKKDIRLFYHFIFSIAVEGRDEGRWFVAAGRECVVGCQH